VILIDAEIEKIKRGNNPQPQAYRVIAS